MTRPHISMLVPGSLPGNVFSARMGAGWATVSSPGIRALPPRRRHTGDRGRRRVDGRPAGKSHRRSLVAPILSIKPSRSVIQRAARPSDRSPMRDVRADTRPHRPRQ
jgi:hypothetical protein